MVRFHILPKQMRYQAALLPDGIFPRGPCSGTQPAMGTKRKCGAHRVTLFTTLRATLKNRPRTRRESSLGLTRTKGNFAMDKTDILQIARRMKMGPDVAMMGVKHGPDLMALYDFSGKLIAVFDSLRELDIIPADGPDDQPVTMADLMRARLDEFDTMDMVGTTYFIGGDEGAIKIGRTINLPVRLKDIQSCSPIVVRVLATRRGGERERLYHRLYAEHRLSGEWFTRHPDILDEITRLSAHPVGWMLS